MSIPPRVRTLLFRPTATPRVVLLLLIAVMMALFSAGLRYNDPEGEFAGLTDDHFFYAIRGWQMLFGDLPDRDYVDPGAPLTLAISAALQVWHRSIWPEFLFGVVMLSLAAGITCAAAARISGSIALGAFAALFEIALFPRLYNYPKLIVYAVAIPAVWAWITAPRTSRLLVIALVTAAAFLLRHDHGVYVAATFILAALLRAGTDWRGRLRRVGLFAGAVLLLLTPYFIHLQVNGGIARHVDTPYRWSVRDRDRAPLVLPALERRPLRDPARAGEPFWWRRLSADALAGYSTFWFFWLLMALPILALVLAAMHPRDGPPDPASNSLRIGVVAALALLLNDGFLRGNLAVRFADVSVPAAILGAWSVAATFSIVRSGRLRVGRHHVDVAVGPRAAMAVLAAAVVVVTMALQTPMLREELERSSLLAGPRAAVGDALDVTARLRRTWPLADWASGDRRGRMQLALYLEACTAPADRVFVTPYLPASIGLAGRAFAGGHGDLRPGFFATRSDQELTLARLQGQSVPVVIAPPRAELADFAENLPLVSAYLQREYENLGDHDLGEGLVVSVLVRRTARAVRTYERLSLPCFR